MASPQSSRLARDSGVHSRLGPYDVVAAKGFGPRVVSLRRDDSPEIFARLSSDIGIDSEQTGTYRFRGGHRLWASPEIPEITHMPDDHECLVTTDENLLVVTGPRDRAGFEKEIRLQWDGVRLVVDHTLRWTGDEPIEAGPWAITQLPLGGVAILPISAGDARALQADSSLVVWPYTRLDDSRLSWAERAVFLQAAAGPAIKLGSGPSPGGLGYLKDGYLFTKQFASADGGVYPDREAVGQVYVSESFCELESVGTLAHLEPGGEAGHREIWEVSRCPDLETALQGAASWGAG